MLQISALSTDRDLTTTSALKSLILGATATSTAQDTQFSNIIRQASRWAESYLGYPITAQSYRETLAAYGRRRLMLSRTPLLGVEGVFDATDTGQANELRSSEYIVEDADAGFLARDQGFAWTAAFQFRSGPRGTWGTAGDAIPLEPAPLPGQEYRPWMVDYVAGYTYAGLSTDSPNYTTAGGTTSTGRTLPEDIEQAVLLYAQSIYVNPVGVLSERLGDVEVRYNSRSVGLDTPQEALLGPYQRVV